MDEITVEKIRGWFTKYADGFIDKAANEEDRQNFELKRLHTLNVAENARLIAREEGFKGNIIALAEIAGLLHDIGRFQQYARHRTFNDRISVNHGELGRQIVTGHEVIKGLLSEPEARAALDAIGYHNSFSVPDIDDKLAQDLLRIIRDADKLDIWGVFAHYYETPPGERSPIVGNNLEDRPTYSKDALEALARGRTAKFSDTSVLNDFKIMNLTWVYDLNFKATFRLMRERNHIPRIAKSLPDTDEIKAALENLDEYISGKL